MIVDRIDNWKQYFAGDTWARVFGFIQSLDPSAEEKKYVLQDDDLFAFVASYETKPSDGGEFEVHRKYIDVQVLLSGTECIEWMPLEGSDETVPYDASKDLSFFSRPEPGASHVDLTPGVFAIYYPEDGHLPQLIASDAPETVKKVVVKVSVELS